MDIVTQKPPYRHSEIYEPRFYTPYQTPPYVSPPYTYASSSGLPSWPPNSAIVTLEDVKREMHHVRFPTPPNTPPRAEQATTISFNSQRTQSVIMKVQSSLSPLHAPADLYALSLDEAKSCSSSSECGANSELVCNWLDCGLLFDSLEALAQHVSQHHAIAALSDGLYYCRWLGCQRSERGFNARYKMLVHVRTHTKEKPHRCHLCDKSFSRAENLKIHIRSHSGEKPYRCTFAGCEKAYSNSSDRFKHTRTHSMDKPYMCKVAGCQKRYTDPSSLRKHVKTFKHSIQLMTSSQPVATDCEEAAVAATRHYYMDVPADYTKHEDSYASGYWLEASSRPSTHSYLHSEDFSMDMQLESPLDLRVNRS